VVKEGQEIDVKVLAIDPENQRISLSLKAAQAAPAAATSTEGADEPEEPLREPVVKRRHEQLKGGTNQASGGEQFGLNW
jgi:small subunit ribosomal protein S1